MKQTILTVLSLMYSFVFCFSQSAEIEAEYLYTKAEESFTNSDFSNAIQLLEKATEKLGSTNPKILYLQIKSYQNKIEKDCNDNIKQDSLKIKSYFDQFFKMVNSDYPKDKYFEVLDAKEKISLFFTGNCSQLKFAALSTKYNCEFELYMSDNVSGIKIAKIKEGKISATKIQSGFVITAINGKIASSIDNLINDLLSQNGNFRIGGFYPGYDGTYSYTIGESSIDDKKNELKEPDKRVKKFIKGNQ